MNTRAIIVLTVLLVFGWAGAALAGEVCDKLPTAPGARVIAVSTVDQLGEAVGDPEALAVNNPAFPTATPGDFVCITTNLTVTAADVGPEGINITIPNITIYGAIVNSTTGARATLTAGTGLTGAIFVVGATGAQTPPAPNGTRNPTNVVITDPTFDCAGISATAITVLPGANNTVIELNTIGGLTGACGTAGVLVQADRDTNNDQARDDTDGDGVLEDTVGTRIRANTFDARSGDSGPAIWLEENVVGVGDPNVGALEDQPPFNQCTGATAGSNHTVIGSSSANAGFDTTAPFGPVVGNGPGADDGNLITSTTGTADWEVGILSEGSHICIRGNVIQTISGAAQPAIDDNGIQLDPGANGTAVWGNIIGSLQVAAPPVPAVGGDGIAVLGPFKLSSVTPDGDSLFDNIVGNVGVAGAQAALRGAADDGFVCQDERIFVQGSIQGAQRAVDNGDDGFDMSNVDADGEGFGCTKRDAVFNNDAINNANSGFELPFGDVVDNDAHNNGGDGFLGVTVGFLCGNVASQNGGDGFDVDDNNTFTDSGTFGSATCARGGNRALANGGDGFEIGGGNVFLPATVPGTPTIGGSPVHFAWCNGDNGVRMGTGGGDSNRIRRVSAINNRNDGFDTPLGSDDNHLSNNVAGNLATLSTTTCTPAGHPSSALALTLLPAGLTAGDQDNGWDNAGGTTASPNRAWRNTFGDPDFENASTLGANFTGNAANGIRTSGGSVVLEESSGTVGSTAAADLDGNGTSGEACNVITNNVAVGFYVASGSGANHQIDDFDGQGGTRLSNIYEQIGAAVDIEHDGTAATILKAEGLWTLVTVGPTPDIDVGPSAGTVQVSSTRVHTRTTVSQLLIDCAGDSGASPPTPPTPGPSNILGDVNGNSSFEQDDVNELLNALRNRASWLTDPSDSKFKVSDVARPCGKITRADYNRLRSSLLRVQRGRPALKSQCGSKGTIGFDPASAPRLLTVLSGQAGAAGVRVAVYDFAGRLLLEQKATGAQVALDLVQRELANGVYLAVVESLDADGRTLVREVRKVIVLR
jgi:hypothetical protein